MIKIAIHCPNFEDGTSFYRLQGPFARLRKHLDCELVFVPRWTAAITSLCDIVLLQRPYDDGALQVAQLAKITGKPLWVEYDDDVSQVGLSHEFSYVYNSHEVRANVSTILQLADLVTVTTEHLKTVIQVRTKSRVEVVPNALDFHLPALKGRDEQMKHERNPIVLFRGSKSHEKDLLEVGVELIDTLRENPQVQFHCMGYNPWFVTECIAPAQWFFTPWSDPHIYLQQLCELRPMVVIHPLEDTKFNRSKSNCSWLEATVAGAPFITRKLPEFEKPGVLTWTTPAEFKEALLGVITKKYPAAELVAKSWEHVQANYDLDKINEIRIRLIKDLLA